MTFSPDKTLVRALLVTVCRLLTGINARWRAIPQAEQPTIYYANHSSHLDGLVIWASLPATMRDRVHPVAAADYWQKSALRRYLSARIFGAVLIERKRKSGAPFSSEDLLAPLVTVLEKQESLIFFPEGTRGGGDELGEFKSGLFHLLQRYPDARLVPVWLENLNRVLPKGSRLVVPIICSATFGEAITGPAQDETKIEFLNRAKQALEVLSHA
ncbi:lysophospholipid acyltransferase family protein [Candidatus Symbiopectobacterium sp. NZEC135]|uniref:lysophospholipid acyltransferase family protein n=1 Tax=Candidatus Symbiopectobacterium sp. NZEC135 TaxID=2820471 RepID=UPI002226EA30|nr:lysophospholipid acyltransferase family protein [Candidatus Symbiopectobacterium sp. NZEC135]MCW2481347.1 1-acyl-sn-glycerol-3-phosphate acyltransferase [Candidatus Symbiopectobacterium sp. NZEC135]